MYMRIKSSNKIKLYSILSAQNVKCKVTKGRQILSGHPNLTYATTLLATIYIIELTVGFETNITFNADRKRDKYQHINYDLS